MIHASAAVTVLALSTLAAQSVGVTLTALTPLSIQTSDGTTTVTNSWPAGPMPGNGGTCATLPANGSGGNVQWQSSTQIFGAYATLRHQIGNPTLLPNFTCQAGPHEILIEFSSPIARTAKLQLNRNTSTWPGAPWPTVQVDIDNDGVFEITNLPTWNVQMPTVSFGPQPLQVRVVIEAALGAQIGSGNHVTLSLLPDNDLTISQPIIGCNPVSPPRPAFLHPSFDNLGVDLLHGNSTQPEVMVLSLAALPTLLSMNGTSPCILLPQPDIVLFVPSGRFNLPLPASVRPMTFFAQGVTLTPSGLRVTDGYAVTAN